MKKFDPLSSATLFLAVIATLPDKSSAFVASCSERSTAVRPLFHSLNDKGQSQRQTRQSQEGARNSMDSDLRKKLQLVPRPPTHPPPIQSLATEIDSDAPRKDKDTSLTPPSDLDSSYDLLARELEASTEEIEQLTNTVTELQDELEASRDAWEEEKALLLEQIADLQEQLVSSVPFDKLEDDDEAYEMERLQREVALLQDQMVYAINALKAEQQKTRQLESKLQQSV